MRLRKSKTPSFALSPDYSTRLAACFSLNDSVTDQSRLRTIHDNTDALAWRLALIEQAEHSIDAQYYRWHLDTSGLLLIDKLIDAADRGVRIRLLLDDIHTFGVDRQIATLNRHKNIEVRLFNPFTYRSRFKFIRLLELLFKLSRLNHRMHNKLLIADNLLAIVGGRNIGDEYLGLADSHEFRDLDLLLGGACITELSNSFDAFWNHRLSFTVLKLIALRPRVLDFNHLRKQIKNRLHKKHGKLARCKLHAANLLASAQSSALLPITAKVIALYDAPEFDASQAKSSIDSLYQHSRQAHEQIIIVSAYFIPDEALLVVMENLIKTGTRIQVYTNSLASIDVTVAFSSYQECRQRLLAMGIELHEKRAQHITDTAASPQFSLHAKCIVYDCMSVYVGTLNLDPRSASLNTEVGLLISSKELAADIADHIDQQNKNGEYWQLALAETSGVLWQSAGERLNSQPSRGLWQNCCNWLFSLLPIKRHL